MGWSFRKSFKVAPGIRLNLSKKGLGASFGVRGLHLGVGSGRKARLTGGIGPFRYYKTIGGAQVEHHGNREVSAAKGCVMGLVKLAAVIVLLPIVFAAALAAFRQHTDVAPPPPPTANPVSPVGVDTHAPPASANPVTSVSSFSFEERVQASQHEAMRKYPDLAMAHSAFNQMFLREYQRQHLAASKRLLDADWPLCLADQCAARIKNPKLPPIPIGG